MGDRMELKLFGIQRAGSFHGSYTGKVNALTLNHLNKKPNFITYLILLKQCCFVFYVSSLSLSVDKEFRTVIFIFFENFRLDSKKNRYSKLKNIFFSYLPQVIVFGK